MASMIMPEKKVFRARVLDPTKRLTVRFCQKCQSQSPKIKRAVAVPPSGMEKEEEMESHLQQAIYAQKATSAGAVVENHVIPTPKVSAIDENEYERIYKKRNGRSKKLIVFRDFVSFFLNQSVYDADSEDEEWLSSRPNISVDQFEQIIFRLEISSAQLDIIQPLDAKALLQKYDSQVVDDVYDYWLQKRKQVASNSYRYTVLVPRLNTDPRRDDKTINPYIAFRRRLDKVQTRKKQKTEIQTYEKILRLNYAIKRSLVLVEIMKQREKAKLLLVNLNEAIFDQQYRVMDNNNQELDRLTATVLNSRFGSPDVSSTKKKFTASSRLENGKIPSVFSPFMKNKQAQRRKIRPVKSRINDFETLDGNDMASASFVSYYNDENAIDEKMLKRNEDVWNGITPTTAANVGVRATIAANAFNLASSTDAMNLIARYNVNSSVDGRYMFSRKFGCQYRAPKPMQCERQYDDEIVQKADEWMPSYVDTSILDGPPSTERDILDLDGGPKFLAIKTAIHSSVVSSNAGINAAATPQSMTSSIDDEQQLKFDSGRPHFGAAIKNEPLPLKQQQWRTLGFIRRRMGRGGRVFYDLSML